MNGYEIIPLPQRPGRPRRRRARGGIPPVPARNGAQYAAAVRALSRMQVQKPPRNPQLRPRGRRRRALISNGGIGTSSEIFMTPANLGVTGRIQSTARGSAGMYPFHGDEQVANISGTAGFGVTQFPINPGQAGMFPWLSRQAELYERYKFTQLEFYYKTTTNQFVATSVGKVVYNVDFDAADPPPVSKQQAMDSEPAVSCAPYENMQLTVSPSDLNSVTGWRYIRPGGLPGGSDIKTYDVGNLNVVTDSNGGTAAIGELHVRYSGLFKDRVLESQTSSPNNNSISWFQSSGPQTYATTVAETALLETATANGLSIVNTAGSLVPPPGNYTVDFHAHTTDGTAEAFTSELVLQKNGVSVFQAAGNRCVLATPAGATAAQHDVSCTVFVTADGDDAFTLVGTLTGAAGALALSASSVWHAV